MHVEELTMPTMELIQLKLAKLTPSDYVDVKDIIQPHERLLGPLSDHEIRLYSLKRAYLQKNKQLRATLILLEDAEEKEENEIREIDALYEGIHTIVSNLLWNSLRQRFHAQLSEIKLAVLGIRTGFQAVTYPGNPTPYEFEIIKGLLK